MVQITLTFDEMDWCTIQRALYEHAGELSASEVRRTGGRGFASGGVASHVGDVHRIHDQIREARDALRTDKD